MKKLTFLTIGASVLAISAAALTGPTTAAAPDGFAAGKKVFAHAARTRGGFAGGAPLITLALNHKDELKLTGEQVSNLENIRSQYQAQVTPTFQQVRAIEKEIATLMRQTPADLIQVKAKIQEAEKYRSELRYLRLEALENGKSVLTQEQRDQLKTLLHSQRGQFHRRQGQPS